MDLQTLNQIVLISDVDGVSFLHSYGHISEYEYCESESIMREVQYNPQSGKERTTWAYPNWECRTEKSIKCDSTSLSPQGCDGRLRSSISLRSIVLLLYLYLSTNSTYR